MKKYYGLTFMLVVLLTACTKSDVPKDVYGDEATGVAASTPSVIKPGIEAEDVNEDARLYFNDEESSWIGLNMSYDDVQSVLDEVKIDLGDRSYQYAGEVMKGWWFDGISSLQGDGIILSFDKSGNLFEFTISDHYKTAKDMGIGATKEDVLSTYGIPEYTVMYSEDMEVISFPLNGFSVRCLLENNQVKELKVTETVMQFVLQEFMQ